MARRSKTIYLNNTRRGRRSHTKKRATAIAISMGTLVALGVALWPNGHRMTEGGEVIGIVAEEAYITEALKTLQVQLEATYETTVKIDPIDEIKRVRVPRKELMDPDQLTSYLRETLAIEIEFQEMSVDGEVVGLVASRGIEETLKTELKRRYFDDTSVRAEFVNDISFKPVFGVEADLIALEELVDICSKRDRKMVTHEVQPGDSLSRIAANLGCSITDILKVNEGMTETTPLKIGQVINAEVRVPLVGLELIILPEAAEVPATPAP